MKEELPCRHGDTLCGRVPVEALGVGNALVQLGDSRVLKSFLIETVELTGLKLEYYSKVHVSKSKFFTANSSDVFPNSVPVS